MTEDEKEEFRRANAERFDALMRRLGAKYAWLHPDFDLSLAYWCSRADADHRRIARERDRRR